MMYYCFYYKFESSPTKLSVLTRSQLISKILSICCSVLHYYLAPSQHFPTHQHLSSCLKILISTFTFIFTASKINIFTLCKEYMNGNIVSCNIQECSYHPQMYTTFATKGQLYHNFTHLFCSAMLLINSYTPNKKTK